MEEINIYDDSLKLSEGFTKLLLKLLDEYPHVNIALSGGSTPKTLFDYWAKNKGNIPWQKISFYWGDERCVPPTNDMSNFKMTKEHLFDKVEAIKENSIHRIFGENSPKAEAKRYSELISKEVQKDNGLPSFELIILGLGDDGHTASIFPHQIELWNSKENCVVAEHPETKMERISFSGTLINNAKNIAFLATGKNKTDKVKSVIMDKENVLNKYPAARVNSTKGKLHWFLDKDASVLL